MQYFMLGHVESKHIIRTSFLYRFVYIGTYLHAVVKCEDKATPHYNSWMLADLTMQAQNSYLARSLGTSQIVTDGIQLLKVWLHQRQLDLVSCSAFSVTTLK